MNNLQKELGLLKLALNLTNRAVYEWDPVTGMVHWGDNAASVLPFVGADQEENCEHFFARIHEEDVNRYRELHNRMLNGAEKCELEYRVCGKNGEIYRVQDSRASVAGMQNKIERIVGILGISEESQPQPLPDTRGWNEYPPKFMRHLDGAIRQAQASGAAGALLVFSIDNLSMIIHSYGIGAAESAIAQYQQTIEHLLGEGDWTERLHRDQIGVILAKSNAKETERFAHKLHHTVQHTKGLAGGPPVHILTSVGSVDFPDSAITPSEALDKAYIALSQVTEHGYQSYTREEGDFAQSKNQMAIAAYLREAVQDNKLRLAYQPIIESKTGKVAHYEALLRLVGEDGTISSAGMLIPVAEKMGLIDIIDEKVMQMVVKELRESPDVEIAFNVSNRTTDNPIWLERLTECLNETPEIASRMIVEITETAAQQDLRESALFVASLQALGCQVALDDFGSGYTSFRQLKSLSIDMIKIDGVFVRDLVDNADNRFFVKTLLDFTSGFGLKSIAECVETGEVAKLLMELGVQYMQGFYFGKGETHRPWRKE